MLVVLLALASLVTSGLEQCVRDVKVDVIFAIEATSRIGQDGFEKSVEQVMQFFHQDVWQAEDRFGAFLYGAKSDYGEDETIEITENRDHFGDKLDKIMDTELEPNRDITDHVSMFQKTSKMYDDAGDVGNKKVFIMITDGEPTCDEDYFVDVLKFPRNLHEANHCGLCGQLKFATEELTSAWEVYVVTPGDSLQPGSLECLWKNEDENRFQGNDLGPVYVQFKDDYCMMEGETRAPTIQLDLDTPAPVVAPVTPAPSELNRCACTGSNAGIPEKSYHYGTTFGTECSKWDEKYGDCTKPTSPNWCRDQWCYVQKGCTINGEEGARRSTYKNSGLWYSYEVCGNEDRFDEPGFQYNWETCPKREDPLEVYFAVDASGSIDESEWVEMQGFMKTLLEKGLTHPDDKVGMTTWSKNSVLRYTFDSSVKEVVDDIGTNMIQNKGATWTDEAILTALNAYEDEPVKRPDAKRYLILVTDGLPDANHGPCDGPKKKLIKKRLGELKMKVGILAIAGENQKNYKEALSCLVESKREDQQIVVMSNFYSFYEYRDPTEGDMCVDADLFSTSTTPTEMPTEIVTEKPTDMPTDEPSEMPTPAPTTAEPTAMPTALTAAPTTPPPTECIPEEESESSEEIMPPMKNNCSRKKRNKCSKMDECTWDDMKKVCLGKDGSYDVCEGIGHESTCVDLKNCEWDENMRMCYALKVTRGKNWMDTQGPHFWQTCAENFCNKFTWEGGIDRCHYDPKEDGCGCTGLTKEECDEDVHCTFDNCQCMALEPKCEDLDFKQCKADPRCDVCNDGCVRKCAMAEGEELEENQALILDHHDCRCKILNEYY